MKSLGTEPRWPEGLSRDPHRLARWAPHNGQRIHQPHDAVDGFADAAESALCGYMAWIALAGLAVNAIWSKSWPDPLAVWALTPLIVREGWEALRSQRMHCGCSN
jgi:hypothetical protein